MLRSWFRPLALCATVVATAASPLASVAAVATTPVAPVTPVAATSSPPACTPAMVRFTTSLDGGEYDGMSHSGLRAILINTSPVTCLVPRLPVFAFSGDRGGALPVTQASPLGPRVHPGPVMVPLALAPGTHADSVLRWVSSDAYAANHCVRPTRVALVLGAPIVTAVTTQLCGPAAPAPIGFEAEPWRLAGPAGAATPTAAPNAP